LKKGDSGTRGSSLAGGEEKRHFKRKKGNRFLQKEGRGKTNWESLFSQDHIGQEQQSKKKEKKRRMESTSNKRGTTNNEQYKQKEAARGKHQYMLCLLLLVHDYVTARVVVWVSVG